MRNDLQQADKMIQLVGVRSTDAWVRVLAFLLAQESAVAHLQIENAQNEDEHIHRVTLYRTLD